MAITAGIVTSAKQDFLNGVHQPGHTYNLALYTAAATLGPGTTAYTATGEASGSGYTAGGQALTGRTVTVNGTSVDLDFTDPVFASASVTARGAMIYNDTAAGKNALVVLDFGADKTSTGAAFTVDLVPPTIRLS